MPETGAYAEPTAGAEIQSSKVSEHFDKALTMADRWVSGLDFSSSGLTITLEAPGHLHIAGEHVYFNDDVSKLVTAATTNYVYAEKDGDVVVNTTGVAPTDSVLLYTVAVGASDVDSFTDNRDNTAAFETKVTGLGLGAQSQKITDVADGTVSTDAATYGQLLAQVAAAGAAVVRVATTSAGTLATSFENGDTVDGVVLATGDRILLAGQAAGAENGIRVVAASGAPARATDYDSASDMSQGKLIIAVEGTANAGKVFRLTTTGTIVVDTTALNFEDVSPKTHAATTAAGIHGSTAAATINTLVHRNGSGQSSFADGTNADHAVTKGQLDANATADRARANHTGTQAPATISPQGAGSTLDADTVDGFGTSQTASPSTVAVRDASGRIKAASGAASGDVVIYEQLNASATTYAGVDATTAAAVGDIVAQGPLEAYNLVVNNRGASVPGLFGMSASSNERSLFSLLPPSIRPSTSDTLAPTGVPRAAKWYAKGFYKARSDTPIDGSMERVALGVVFFPQSFGSSTSFFGHETEDVRDDFATVAVVVDDSENIKSYNNAAVGNASYTDSGFDADLSVGMYWEIIVETPSTANSDDDCLVTITVSDSGGTARTILNAVAPVSPTTSNTPVPVFLLNQDGGCEKVVFKVQKAA